MSDFEFYAYRLSFRASDAVHFPSTGAGNTLRGVFGTIFRRIACVPECINTKTCAIRATCPYARIFEPAAAINSGPSGLRDSPRPFVFRAHHLDGQTIRPGERCHFDLHIFDARDPAVAYFVLAFAQLAKEGLGTGRGRARLETVDQLQLDGAVAARIYEGATLVVRDPAEPLGLNLAPGNDPVRRVRVRYVTPTELKSGGGVSARPEFPALFGRIRDRISALRALYGPGPLEIDFRGMGERADRVRMECCEIRHVESARRSSKTGQTHPLGGFTGEAEYEGELAEFLPYLHAARWTGVGRQTVWGKGVIEVETIS
jgi:CRISPR-associated endoribonuclease Cas6